MAITPDYIDYVLEQMRRVPGVVARRMFGGAGLSVRGITFAILDDDVLYLKVGDANRADYEAAGMAAFTPDANKPEYKMSYYEVPAEVLEDPEQLAAWSRKAIAVAEQAKAKQAPAKKSAVKKAAAKKVPAKKTAAKKK